jgi:hypothetical protein
MYSLFCFSVISFVIKGILNVTIHFTYYLHYFFESKCMNDQML